MHKKQAKKQTKNKVGIHKNVPLNIQVPYEEYEEFLGDYLEIKSYDEIFEILESEDDFLECDCSITEEMLFDCLIDEKSGGTEVEELLLPDEEYEDCSLIHSDNYNYLLEMYNKQKEINKRNKEALKKTVVEPLKYFGNVELLREIDVVLETIFKKKKFKRVKKGIKIFERNLKPVDNLAADEIIARRKEFKKIFTSLEFPVPQDWLLEENVKPKMDEKFIKY